MKIDAKELIHLILRRFVSNRKKKECLVDNAVKYS